VHKRKQSSSEIPTDYIAYYPLDFDSHDETGNYDGTDTGVTFDGASAVFNGGSSNIEIEDVANNDLFSISMWFKSNLSGDTEHIYGSKYTANGHEFKIFMYSNAIINIRWYNRSTATLVMPIIVFPNAIESNRYYHIVCTFDGATVKAYLDSTFIDSSTVNASQISTIDKTGYIGNAENVADNRGLDGNVSNVKFYNRALSQEEITQLYNQGY
jgi:hypothetical protein